LGGIGVRVAEGGTRRPVSVIECTDSCSVHSRLFLMLCNAFEYVACIYFMGQLLILHCDLIVTLSVGRSR